MAVEVVVVVVVVVVQLYQFLRLDVQSVGCGVNKTKFGQQFGHVMFLNF